MSLTDPDYAIIKNIIAGRKEDFEKLVDKYQDKVFSMTSRRVPQTDVPDVAQEIFLKIYRGLAKYVPDGSFEGWVATITLRSCCDFWRRQNRNRELLAPELDKNKHQQWLESIASDMSFEASARLSRAKEAGELLDWALNRLSPDKRTLIEMVYLEGYSFKEAAEVFGWKLSKAKVSALRARKKLKELISEYMEFINEQED
jgi:RNA polymerase sigma-70 factor (ECF subfamily)